MHLFGGDFYTIKALNRPSYERIQMNCRCCTCSEWYLLKNSSDLKDLTCTQERGNFDSLRSASLSVFQVLFVHHILKVLISYNIR